MCVCLNNMNVVLKKYMCVIELNEPIRAYLSWMNRMCSDEDNMDIVW